MLLVVALHAGLAYNPTPIRNLIWAVHDPGGTRGFDVLCWWLLGISSPFFLMSGFFAASLHEARGHSAFLVGRCKRIGVPFLVACLTFLPATFYVWACGWLASGQCSLREMERMKFRGKGLQHNLYGPAHLWSLEYLILFLAAFWLFLSLPKSWRSWRPPGSSAWGRALASKWRPLLTAIPTTLVLWAGHRHVGLDAIMDRQNSFTPEPYRLLHNAIFFVVGVGMYHARGDLARLASWGWAYLALSVPAFACRAWLVRGDLARPLDGWAEVALSVMGALFVWLTTFGLMGVALTPALNRSRPAVRYLADSSYWVYLLHLPVIGLMQVGLLGVEVPAILKFVAVLSVTVGLGLGSYQAMVRHTIVGHWMHGRRERVIPAHRQPLGTHRARGLRGRSGRVQV